MLPKQNHLPHKHKMLPFRLNRNHSKLNNRLCRPNQI
jgi:hypothetical protein